MNGIACVGGSAPVVLLGTTRLLERDGSWPWMPGWLTSHRHGDGNVCWKSLVDRVLESNADL